MTSSRRPSLSELAAGQLDDVDAANLAHIAALYGTLDPVPAGLVERIAFGITLDALHAEIAQLERSGDLVGVRSDDVSEAQTITFTSSQLTTMITVTPLTSERVRIDGWVVPGAGVDVELRLSDGVRHVSADEDGRFVFDDVSRGLAQFTMRHPGGSSGSAAVVVTPSITL